MSESTLSEGTRTRTSTLTWLMLGLLLAAAAVVWLAALSGPDGRLHVFVLDVGQGDAILIRTPHGRQVLIDGGPSPVRLLDDLSRRLPFYDRSLDVVLLSHPQDDHLLGQLAVFERFEVALALDPGGDPDRRNYAAWQRAAEDGGARVVRARRGQVVRLDGDLRLEVLRSGTGEGGDGNEGSLVVRLTDGRFCALFPGDLPASQQPLLAHEEIACDVLKVPHHGAADALDPRFLADVQPRLAVISVGAENRFGHPAPSTLALLDRRAVPAYRTDRDGTVEVIADGATVRVRTQR